MTQNKWPKTNIVSRHSMQNEDIFVRISSNYIFNGTHHSLTGGIWLYTAIDSAWPVQGGYSNSVTQKVGLTNKVRAPWSQPWWMSGGKPWYLLNKSPTLNIWIIYNTWIAKPNWDILMVGVLVTPNRKFKIARQAGSHQKPKCSHQTILNAINTRSPQHGNQTDPSQ